MPSFYHSALSYSLVPLSELTRHVFVFGHVIEFRGRRCRDFIETRHVQLVHDVSGASGPEHLALGAAAERHDVAVLVKP